MQILLVVENIYKNKYKKTDSGGHWGRKSNLATMDGNTNVNILNNAQQRRTSLCGKLVLHTSLHDYLPLLTTLVNYNYLRKHAHIIITYYCRTPVISPNWFKLPSLLQSGS